MRKKNLHHTRVHQEATIEDTHSRQKLSRSHQRNNKKDKVDVKERISTRDVISLKCIRFYVDEIMMIYIYKEGCTPEIVTTRRNKISTRKS